jgi:hypothetical protein
MAIELPAELRNLHQGFVVYNLGTGTGATVIPATGGTPITMLAAMSTVDQAALNALVLNTPGSGLLKGVMGCIIVSPTVALNYTYSTTGAQWTIPSGAAPVFANVVPIINPQSLGSVLLISNTAATITDAKVLMFIRNGA